jgi:hypothetical protein
MKQSRYLKTDDVDPEVLVTIQSCSLEKIDEDTGEEKHVLHVREFDKPLVLNWTNIQLIAKATGCEDSDEWAGHQVILYHDETVMFKGKVTGGIRVRAVKKKAAAVDEGPNDPIPGWDDEEAVA